jgi:hypothetical protein
MTLEFMVEIATASQKLIGAAVEREMAAQTECVAFRIFNFYASFFVPFVDTRVAAPIIPTSEGA